MADNYYLQALANALFPFSGMGSALQNAANLPYNGPLNGVAGAVNLPNRGYSNALENATKLPNVPTMVGALSNIVNSRSPISNAQSDDTSHKTWRSQRGW